MTMDPRKKDALEEAEALMNQLESLSAHQRAQLSGETDPDDLPDWATGHDEAPQAEAEPAQPRPRRAGTQAQPQPRLQDQIAAQVQQVQRRLTLLGILNRLAHMDGRTLLIVAVVALVLLLIILPLIMRLLWMAVIGLIVIGVVVYVLRRLGKTNKG